MTAVMTNPFAAPTERPDTDALRDLLLDLHEMVAEQGRMLDTLDARREQLDELVADAMPAANAALLLATRTAQSLDASIRSLAAIRRELDVVRRAQPPGLLALLWRLRAPEARKALALGIQGLRLLGRIAEGETPERGDSARAASKDHLHQRARRAPGRTT